MNARVFKTLAAGLLLAAALPMVLCGCGKKGPPVPIAAKVPEPVTELSFTLREGVVRLGFRLPEKYRDKSPLEGESSVLILRAQVDFGDRDCPDCPREFREILATSLDLMRGLVRERGLAFYSDRDVKPGTRYLYEVVVRGLDGGVSPADVTLTVDVIEPPAAPEAIAGTYKAKEVSLSWSGVAHPERRVFYNVYRMEKGGKFFSRINRADLEKNAFVDITARPENVYSYGVRAAVREKGTLSESGLSKRIAAGPIPFPRPPAPLGLAAVPADGQVNLRWEPVDAEGLSGYRIIRSGGVEGEIVLTPKPVADTVYTDTDVRRGTVYTYRVSAVAGKKVEMESEGSEPRNVFVP